MNIAKAERFLLPLISFVTLVVVAFSWLVFPYLMNGDKVLFNTGSQVKVERAQKSSHITQLLTRQIAFPGGVNVKVLYASEEYFEYADRSDAVAAYRPDTHLIFFITENVHTGLLPRGLAKATLWIDGNPHSPVQTEGPEWAEHHRTTAVRFSKIDANNQGIIDSNTKQLLLELSHPWDRNLNLKGIQQDARSTYIWNLPLAIPDKLKSRSTFTTAMVFSLSAGLLSSVLTPCLLQLVIVFLATLGGVSASEASNTNLTKVSRRKVMQSALYFVAGYIALFVVSGALIGYIGKEAQLFFAIYAHPVAVVSGIIVVLFGLWLGIGSQTERICRLPGAKIVQKMQGKGTFSCVLVAIAFSLGCMSCFGGAIIGTLFIYVGALGSPSVGAAIMAIFAAGVAIPFLLSALFFTRVKPLFEFVGRYAKPVGTSSALIVIAFGILLITDSFHTVSDMLYPYLGLD